jgi:hypothetical protein
MVYVPGLATLFKSPITRQHGCFYGILKDGKIQNGYCYYLSGRKLKILLAKVDHSATTDSVEINRIILTKKK